MPSINMEIQMQSICAADPKRLVDEFMGPVFDEMERRHVTLRQGDIGAAFVKLLHDKLRQFHPNLTPFSTPISTQI